MWKSGTKGPGHIEKTSDEKTDVVVNTMQQLPLTTQRQRLPNYCNRSHILNLLENYRTLVYLLENYRKPPQVRQREASPTPQPLGAGPTAINPAIPSTVSHFLTRWRTAGL